MPRRSLAPSYIHNAGGGVHVTAGLPVTQMETVANTSIAAPKIPMPSQNFAVAMAPHVANNKDVISTYANDSAESLCLARMAPSLSYFLDSSTT